MLAYFSIKTGLTSKSTSAQPVMVLTFGYDFLKHSGKVIKIWSFEGQFIKYRNSFDNILIQVIQIWYILMLDVLNLKTRSSASNPNLNLIIVIKRYCYNVSFLSGPHLMTWMSTLSSLRDSNLILVCAVLRLLDLRG